MIHVACLINWALKRLHLGEVVIDNNETGHGELSKAQRCSKVQDITRQIYENDLFGSDGGINTEIIQEKIRDFTLQEVLSVYDVDHYNLLDKAIIYNCLQLVEVLLKGTIRSHEAALIENEAGHVPKCSLFAGTIHLACFLGTVEIVAAMLRYAEYDDGGKLCDLHAGVRIGHVQGPSNHLFRKLGYTGMHFEWEKPDMADSLHWARTHIKETPATFAACADHVTIMQMMSRDSILAGNMDSLIGAAWSCGSVACLDALLKSDPSLLTLKNGGPCYVFAKGFSNGPKMVHYALENGLCTATLNNMDSEGMTTALHLYYHILPRQDYTFSKYYHIYSMTKLLVEKGTDLNQETDLLTSLLDTPLHGLIDQINIIVRHPKVGWFVDKLENLQRKVDEDILNSIELILDSGFDIRKHMNTLLKRVCSNRNHLMRFTASQKIPAMRRAGYGLRNVMKALKLLVKKGATLTLKRGDVSPLSILISGLDSTGGVKCVFESDETLNIFASCVDLLLENGNHPNIYPRSSAFPSPLIHFVDTVSENLGKACLPISESKMAIIKGTIHKLCKQGAQMSCWVKIDRSYMKHGVFDDITKQMYLMHKHSSVQLLKWLTDMCVALFQWDVDAKVEDYLQSAISLYGTPQAKHSLLYHVLFLGLSDMFSSSPLDILLNDHYFSLLEVCLHQADHQTYYSCLRAGVDLLLDHRKQDLTKIEHNAIANEFAARILFLCHNVHSLKQLCRLSIRKYHSSKRVRNFSCFPLPKLLSEYLTSFRK